MRARRSIGRGMLARPMRAVSVLLVLLAAVAVGLYVFVLRGEDLPPPSGDPAAPRTAPSPAGPSPVMPNASGPGLGTDLVATRTAPPSVPDAKLADAPTAWLHVVDRATGGPVAGAPVRRLQGGAEIAFTDERGLAPVALRDPEQLVVVVDGYLLRLVP